jgi:hypothetical protein
VGCRRIAGDLRVAETAKVPRRDFPFMGASPYDSLERLIEVFPDFTTIWKSPNNLFREDDGTFTQCGVFAECSHYICERYESISQEHIEMLDKFLNRCMAQPGTDLDIAATTCFLENLIEERFSDEFEAHLTGQALQYFRKLRRG